jgi:hypothetical protein
MYDTRIISTPGEACLNAVRLKKSHSNNDFIQMRNHLEQITLDYSWFTISRIDELIKWDEGMAEHAPRPYKTLFLNDAIDKCKVAQLLLSEGKSDMYGQVIVAKLGVYNDILLRLKEKRHEIRTRIPSNKN